METTREFTRALFSIEILEDIEYEGFTDGNLWNGWSCPYFSFETATRILTSSESNGYLWKYEKELDTFIVHHTDDPQDFEPEHFQGIRINVEGRDVTAYAIGAFSWAWVFVQ